jgi:hypothetical protein
MSLPNLFERPVMQWHSPKAFEQWKDAERRKRVPVWQDFLIFLGLGLLIALIMLLMSWFRDDLTAPNALLAASFCMLIIAAVALWPTGRQRIKLFSDRFTYGNSQPLQLATIKSYSLETVFFAGEQLPCLRITHGNNQTLWIGLEPGVTQQEARRLLDQLTGLSERQEKY